MRLLFLFFTLIFVKIDAFAQFQNPGVFSTKVSNILYEWIPSENVNVSVANGKVRIIAPLTKRSWNGRNTCNRFVFGDVYDNRLPEAEERALFGEGLALPPGNYAFRILYLNSSNWNHAKQHLWNLIGIGSGSEEEHSAQMETVYLSITDGSPIKAGISIPSDLLRASFLPHYQLLSYNLKLPADKAFGTTRYIVGAKDLFSKITHLQYVYSWLDNVPNSQKWKNVQALNHQGQLAQPDWLIRNTPIDRNFITIGEMAENYGNIEGNCPNCYSKAESVFKGLYDRYKKELRVTSPQQTRLYDDYYAGLYGYSFGINFETVPVNQLAVGLQSVENARRRFHDNRWHNSAYFTEGAYNYRNYRIDGYLGNLFHTLQRGGLYHNVYNLEKANLAANDRKFLKNGWAAAEGLRQDRITDAGVWQRLKLNEGEVLRLSSYDYPVHTMMAESFYHLLLGNDYVLWNSNIPVNTDPYTFTRSQYGGLENWKTKWKPANNGQAIEYEAGKKGHPKRKETKDNSQFPETSLQGETGAFIGAWLYSQISGVSDRVSKSVRYTDFSLNGKVVRVEKGRKGDGSVSSRVGSNPGQTQIVKSYQQQLPICIITEGKNGKAVIYQNPNAGLVEQQVVKLPDGKTFTVTNNRLHVFYL